MVNLKTHLDLLGLRVEDRVTSFRGVVTSVCFDLYGCIQATVNPGTDKDGKPQDSHWFDVNRLHTLEQKPVMSRPDFEWTPEVVSAGGKGPAERPRGFRALTPDISRVPKARRLDGAVMPHITENEMTTKHSPGPWTFQEHGSLILDARTGSSQCAVAHVQVNTYKDEGMHNARLIAAAPDLLSALVEAVDLIETISPMEGDTLRRARAAIAKASGA